MSRRLVPSTSQRELFGAAPQRPEGFAYADEVVSAADEKALIAWFEQLPFKPFEFYAFRANRHVISFGWSYDYTGATLRRSDAIPPALLPLRAQAAAFA